MRACGTISAKTKQTNKKITQHSTYKINNIQLQQKYIIMYIVQSANISVCERVKKAQKRIHRINCHSVSIAQHI